MLTFLPQSISNKAVGAYIVSLIAVTVLYSAYAMDFMFFVFGLVGIVGFFMVGSSLTKSWQGMSQKAFISKLFWTALSIRMIWAVSSYYFYKAETGQPFEWDAADALGYHEEAKWLATLTWENVMGYLFRGNGVSDSGYTLYLTPLYKLFGPDIIIARMVKALWSAWTCVLVYKLSSRTFGEGVGRMAGIFALLWPNLIYYCGIHTKETEMVFCAMMYLERADYLIRSKKYSVVNIVVPIAFAFSLFLFRTVLGVVAIFAFFTALFFTSDRIAGKAKKTLLIIWWVVAVVVLAGGTIMSEVESYWDMRVTNEVAKRESQESGGAEWAKYATGTVMAPMIFTVPFATMVDIGQRTQTFIHGGAFVKNFMSIFVFIAIFYSIVRKKWKDFSLIGAYVIGYLGIISFSGYANAERFHMPALPVVIMMAAYGVSLIDKKNIKYVNAWPYVVIVMEVAWAYFKLGSRGMV